MSKNFKALKDKRILIVEDDSSSARLFTDLLSEYGAVTKNIDNGIDSINYVKNNVCDIVVLDLRIPGENGFVVAEQIKQIDEFPPKIIVVSAFADKQNRVHAFEVGADAFFSKPVNLKEFLLVISNFAAENYRQKCFEALKHLNALQEENNTRIGHGVAVVDICKSLAKFFNIEDDQLIFLEEAALLHDLGKIASNASKEESSHSSLGANIIESHSYYKQVAFLVRHHHDFQKISECSENIKILLYILQLAERIEEVYPNSPLLFDDDIKSGFFSKEVIEIIKEKYLLQVKQY